MINRDKYLCYDCRIDTRKKKKNVFMVKDALWEEYGVGNKFLCIDCFEKRLKREIQLDDITECFINQKVNPYTILLLDSYKAK